MSYPYHTPQSAYHQTHAASQPPPPPPPNPPDEHLPPHIIRYFDNSRNRPYYYNTETKETTWEPPLVQQPSPSSSSQQLPQITPQQVPPGTPQQAPPGTPQQAPPGTPQQAPPGTPLQIPPGSPQHIPPGTQQQMPLGTQQQMPPGTQQHMLTGTPQQMPPGTQHMPPGGQQHFPPSTQQQPLRSTHQQPPPGTQQHFPSATSGSTNYAPQHPVFLHHKDSGIPSITENQPSLHTSHSYSVSSTYSHQQPSISPSNSYGYQQTYSSQSQNHLPSQPQNHSRPAVPSTPYTGQGPPVFHHQPSTHAPHTATGKNYEPINHPQQQNSPAPPLQNGRQHAPPPQGYPQNTYSDYPSSSQPQTSQPPPHYPTAPGPSQTQPEMNGNLQPNSQHHALFPDLNAIVANLPGMQNNPNIQKPDLQPSSSLYDSSMQPNSSFYHISETQSYMQPVLGKHDNTAVFIELELRAIELRKKDIIGTSDPICYVQVPDRRAAPSTKKSKWKTIGKTEVLRNTTSPCWSKRIRFPYLFEEHQPLRFFLIDVDNMKTEKGDALGVCETTMAQIVRGVAQTIPLASVKGTKGKYGKLIIRAHDENDVGQVRLELLVGANGLQNVDFLGKSDPYYSVSCTVPDNTPSSNLGKSEYINNNLNPKWRPLRITVPTRGFDWDKVLLTFTVYDWNSKRSHKKLGDAVVSLEQLLTTSSLQLRNPQNKRRKSHGELVFQETKATEVPTFVSFIQGGLKMKFVVAVDFTASNKPVHLPNSLHYIGDPNNPSPSVYAQALHAVGSVICGYIQDESITALGFGAKIPNHREASFDFSLSGDPDPTVRGVDGLLKAYRDATSTVTLSGPTLFQPLIRHVMEFCKRDPVRQDNQYFTVLLILTDGRITDLEETIEAIIDASYSSPLSIVIVGVGDADFSTMEYLDSDEKTLTSLDKKRHAKHDIVQFTKFDESKSLETLAAEVLHEVPQRLVEYMMDQKITPNAPLEQM